MELERTIQQITIENEELLRELDYSRRLQADRQQQFETLQSVMAQLSADLKSRDERIESLQTEKEELFETGVKSDHEIAELREAYQQRLTELANLQTALTSRSGEVEQLQSEIVELQEERQILLRPARSPVNRYVVDVIFNKSLQGENVFHYRLPGEAAAVRVSREELEAVLARLKSERSEGLYTRVIFPDEDRLTFSEAWAFTQHIQSNYDYYSNQ